MIALFGGPREGNLFGADLSENLDRKCGDFSFVIGGRRSVGKVHWTGRL